MLALYLLILCLPLGVAGQNIGLGTITAILIGLAVVRRRELQINWTEYRPFVVLAGVVLITTIVGLYTNPESPAESAGKFLGGYGAWWLMPWIFAIVLPPLSAKHWTTIGKVSAVVMIILGVIAISQYLFGWRIKGMSVVEDSSRARGLYSHPLTFAYVGLMLFVPAVGRALGERRSVLAWVAAGFSLAVVVFSLSRTVLAICLVAIGVFAIWQLRGRLRVGVIALLLLGSVVTMVTDNPVSRRFAHVVKRIDVAGDQVDDRVIFWRVAMDMIAERPWLGHGPELDTAYRTPYYERAGYGQLEKKYEAHNTYLQVWVNGGIVALVGFLGWWLVIFIRASRWRHHWSGSTAMVTIGCFLTASLTQNSFQDSEVRYAVVTGATLLLLFARDQAATQTTET